MTHEDRTVRGRKLFPINGRTYELNALTMRDYIQIREAALKHYREGICQHWADQAKYLPEDKRVEVMMDAITRTEQIQVEDLPPKKVKVPAMDASGAVKRDEDGQPIILEKEVEYTMWWLGETLEGKTLGTWLSLRRSESQKHMTLEDVDALFEAGADGAELLDKTADEVGELTRPQLGN